MKEIERDREIGDKREKETLRYGWKQERKEREREKKRRYIERQIFLKRDKKEIDGDIKKDKDFRKR